MKSSLLKFSFFAVLFSMITLFSCQKKSADLMKGSDASDMNSVINVIDKNVGYFEFGILRTEVLDSTNEMVGMMDMMIEMMKKDIETTFMVDNHKLMEYKTDVTGNLTNFSIYDSNTGLKEAFSELDMEKVYTVYNKATEEIKKAPDGATITHDDETKVIHGYNCKRITMGDEEMKMIAYLTEEIKSPKTLPAGIEGFPLELHLQMGGMNIITGVTKYSPTLPNPEFFNVDKSGYREVTNDEFPKQRSMF